MASLDEQMNVVWHKAVRNNVKLAVISGTRQLHHGQSHGFAIHKYVKSIERADGQEIAVETEVLESSQPRRWVSRHAYHRATAVPHLGRGRP